jgi:hypothetical protein
MLKASKFIVPAFMSLRLRVPNISAAKRMIHEYTDQSRACEVDQTQDVKTLESASRDVECTHVFNRVYFVPYI